MTQFTSLRKQIGQNPVLLLMFSPCLYHNEKAFKFPLI